MHVQNGKVEKVLPIFAKSDSHDEVRVSEVAAGAKEKNFTRLAEKWESGTQLGLGDHKFERVLVDRRVVLPESLKVLACLGFFIWCDAETVVTDKEIEVELQVVLVLDHLLVN
jgi:hypothetical protein